MKKRMLIFAVLMTAALCFGIPSFAAQQTEQKEPADRFTAIEYYEDGTSSAYTVLVYSYDTAKGETAPVWPSQAQPRAVVCCAANTMRIVTNSVQRHDVRPVGGNNCTFYQGSALQCSHCGYIHKYNNDWALVGTHAHPL